MLTPRAPALALLALLSLTAAPARADKDAFYDSDKYNSGDYGVWVTQEFITDDVVTPWLNFMMPFSACDDGSYYFVAPRGNIADSMPYILDANGSLVWAPDVNYGEVYNFFVQTYKGQDYLTFWSGNDAIGGHGEGVYHMLDQHYEEYRQVEGANGLGADLHSFSITADGTATCTLYDIHEMDVSSVRHDHKRPRGYVWDSLFQEIDIETGEALFQWRATDHFPLTDAYHNINIASESDPWDFFHINCVEKDAKGNYLISSRYLRTIAYIDGRNGSVLWQLGGKGNSFTDLSDGEATRIVGQHDAHWHPDGESITFFDNRGDWFYQASRESWGARVKLDLDAMTAELVQTYRNPNHIYSFSQGSYQTLPNGNVVIGYGFNGAFTEFTPEGEALCDAYMQPRSRFGSGEVQSYRNMKFNWTGIPKTQPALVLHKNALYMSWKGSTQTRGWLLEHSSSPNATFEPLMTLAKDGFETRFPLTNGLCTRDYLRVIALDEHGARLATSDAVLLEHSGNRCNGEWRGEATTAETEMEQADEETAYDDGDVAANGPSESDAVSATGAHEDLAKQIEDLQLLIGFAVLAILSGLLIAWLTLGSRFFRMFCRWGAVGRDFDIVGHPSRHVLPNGLLDRARVWLLGKSARRGWRGRSAVDEEDTMLSDVELSGDENDFKETHR